MRAELLESVESMAKTGRSIAAEKMSQRSELRSSQTNGTEDILVAK